MIKMDPGGRKMNLERPMWAEKNSKTKNLHKIILN